MKRLIPKSIAVLCVLAAAYCFEKPVPHILIGLLVLAGVINLAIVALHKSQLKLVANMDAEEGYEG